MSKCNFCAAAVAILLLSATGVQAVHVFEADGPALGLFGTSISALGDLTGDGSSELLIGAPGVLSDDGRVCLWYGGMAITQAPVQVLAGAPDEYFGFCVARIGDVNGGGDDDFAIGAPLSDQAGTDAGLVYVFYGENVPSQTPDAIIEGPTVGGQFGFSIAAAGDIDGDNRDDMIVGAPFDNTDGIESGAAYVYYGDNIATDATPDLTLGGLAAYDHFGWSVCGAGDFLAGADCVAVGAPGNMTIDGPCSVLVFEGETNTITAPDSDVDFTATGANGAHFGWCVANAGQWNIGSYDDLVIGAPHDNSGGADAGRVEIFTGASTPSTSPYRYVNGADGDDLFGYSVAGVGDVTDSGEDDVLIGAPGHAADGTDAGRVYFFEGNASSQSDAESLDPIYPATGVNPGSLADDRYGQWVASAGDFDGDGLPDMVVGADGGNIANNTVAGYVHVLDSSGSATPVMLSGWDADWAADGGVLLSFQLSADARQVEALALTRREVRSDGLAEAAVTVFAGTPASLQQVSNHDDLWQLHDTLPISISGADLSYDLAIELTDGRTYSLLGQNGPPPALQVDRPELRPAVPNPFNPSTSISFRAQAGRQTTCRILDARGGLVTTLFQGRTDGTWQTLVWNGMSRGRPAPAGVYFVNLDAGGRTAVERIVLVK